MNNTPLLSCSKLSKRYQEGKSYTEVLRGVNFTLQRGEMVAIVGSSGSGKSTLLHLLGGLDEPSGGEVIFEGQSLNTMSSTARAFLRNRRLGFIYQFHHLLPDFTTLENVAMPLLIAGIHPNLAQGRGKKILSEVGLEQCSHYRPADLSGGERQRVAIARALVNNPSLILADEPTGNLDSRNADNLFQLLKRMNISQGTAFLVVTHDLKLAKRLHRQFEMRDGALSDISK